SESDRFVWTGNRSIGRFRLGGRSRGEVRRSGPAPIPGLPTRWAQNVALAVTDQLSGLPVYVGGHPRPEPGVRRQAGLLCRSEQKGRPLGPLRFIKRSAHGPAQQFGIVASPVFATWWSSEVLAKPGGHPFGMIGGGVGKEGCQQGVFRNVAFTEE